jgi:hypothetical protein
LEQTKFLPDTDVGRRSILCRSRNEHLDNGNLCETKRSTLSERLCVKKIFSGRGRLIVNRLSQSQYWTKGNIPVKRGLRLHKSWRQGRTRERAKCHLKSADGRRRAKKQRKMRVALITTSEETTFWGSENNWPTPPTGTQKRKLFQQVKVVPRLIGAPSQRVGPMARSAFNYHHRRAFCFFRRSAELTFLFRPHTVHHHNHGVLIFPEILFDDFS